MTGAVLMNTFDSLSRINWLCVETKANDIERGFLNLSLKNMEYSYHVSPRSI